MLNLLRRANWLSSLVLLAAAALLVGLLGRVGWLQTHVTRADLQELRAQHVARVAIMARRASIYTSDSTLIAGSVRIYSMYADPGYIMDPQGKLNALSGNDAVEARELMARTIAPLLNCTPDQVMETLKTHLYYKDGSLRRFLWLKRGVDYSFYARFAALRNKFQKKAMADIRHGHSREAEIYYHALDGIRFDRSTRRVYPLGSFAGQVSGFANSQTGLQGLENQLNALLVGRQGDLVYVKDAAERALWIDKHGYKPANDGMRVWLTINSTIQGFAEEELDKACSKFEAASGSAVVMNPRNGDILAMANYPPLDPNNYQSTPEKYWRNRAVTDPFEPGSVFKPFNVAWALQHHVVTLNEMFNCHDGRYRDPTGRLITDVDGYGELSVTDILVHSSNIGMTQVGWKMGIPLLASGVRAFGFGRMTGCALPGDSPGLVRPEAQWTRGTLTSASFGYGVGVTALQMARAFCVFGSGGLLPTPQIVQAVQALGGPVYEWSQLAGPPEWRRIISRHVCHEMRGALEQVMVRGTGQYSISRYYRLFGKTGTANLAIPGADRYHAHQYNATFIAGGPTPYPRLICVVAVHKPNPHLGHFGGTVAGPACSKILEKSLLYMQVPPDQGPQTDPWWGKEAEMKKLKGLSH